MADHPGSSWTRLLFEGRRFSLLAFGVLATSGAATTVPVVHLGRVGASLVGLMGLALMGAECLQARGAKAPLHGPLAHRAGPRQVAFIAG